MSLAVPYLTYSEIGGRALSFLSEYHPSLELPVPIEKIIGVKMELDIVPFPNLYRDFGLSGYLISDRTAIYVDQIQSDYYEEKYRYTLAHELGHYVLHKSFYEELPFRSPDEYVSWRLSIPREDIGWLETHGDWFAGHVLVPSVPLEKICREVVAKHQDEFAKLARIPEDIWSYISNEIATYFEVNPPVVEIRIRKENLPARIPIGGQVV